MIFYGGYPFTDNAAPKHVLIAEVRRLRLDVVAHEAAGHEALRVGREQGSKEERSRIRLALAEEIGAGWESLFTGMGYDAELVQGIRTVVLRQALDRICPEEGS